MRIAVAGSTGLVGRHVVAAAEAAGHEVLGMSRHRGTDLTAGAPPDLTGVGAVIDVTQSGDHTREGATAFFTAVAGNLGAAAHAAGVPRTVVLSIIGIDRTAPEIAHHAAKLAHERATAAAAPGARILRAAQFMDFPGQWIGWFARDGRVEVPDQPIQPVAVTAVAEALVALATDDDAPGLLELAGPRPERLPDLVARVDPAIEVVVVPAGPAVAGGALLAGERTRIAGPDFAAWLRGG